MDEVRYYRLLKENPIWVVGAVISNEESDDQFLPVSDAFVRFPNDECLTAQIVENPANADFFERVYKFVETDDDTGEEVGDPIFKSTLDTREWHHSQYKPAEQ